MSLVKVLAIKLASRKFWMTVATVIPLLLSKQYTAATAVVLAYLGVQGVVDARADTASKTSG